VAHLLQSLARCSVDLVVQRSGHIGSNRHENSKESYSPGFDALAQAFRSDLDSQEQSQGRQVGWNKNKSRGGPHSGASPPDADDSNELFVETPLHLSSQTR